jgi:hypothetical protein
VDGLGMLGLRCLFDSYFFEEQIGHPGPRGLGPTRDFRADMVSREMEAARLDHGRRAPARAAAKS